MAAYDPHELLVQPARPYAQLWRLVLGLALVVGLSFGFFLVLGGVLAVFLPVSWMDGLIHGNTPGQLIILLGAFGSLTLSVGAASCVLHKRSLASVIGPLALTLSQFWQVIWRLAVLGAVLSLLPIYDMGEPLVPNLPLSRWLALLPVSLIVLLIQTSAEEILFRGYIQQTLAARFRHPLMWIGLPSVVFALGHYDPISAGENAWLIAIWAGVFGALMADLTARAGTLGPAIAIHLFNNFSAILVTSTPEVMSGLSLYVMPHGLDDVEMMRHWLKVDLVLIVIFWLVGRLAIRR
jgi:membrane protease YdiL (CAAX protease family)